MKTKMPTQNSQYLLMAKLRNHVTLYVKKRNVTYPDSAAVARTHFVETIFAQQIQEGPISLQKAVFILINGHLLEDPLVH